MVGTLQPLDKKFAIVDKYGNPTDYFVRWAQQKQIDITGAIQLSDLVAYLDAHKIIAGTGIQFSPGPNGDINQSPTIHADVQAILDEITATRGAILFRGNAGWQVLLPGTAGNFLQTAGAGADPLWAAAGGGGGSPFDAPVTKPLAAGFTLVNGGTGTLTDTTTGLATVFPVGVTDTIHLAQSIVSIASTTFSITVRLRPTLGLPNGNHYQSCLIIRNSTNDRQVVFGDWTASTQVLVQNWTTNAAFSGNVAGPSTSMTAAFPWRRIVCTAGTMSFDMSPDGVTWTSIGTATLASFLTAAGGSADKCGIGTRGVGGNVVNSWVQV